eukprot:TRINITY_DN115209_c0_g1_i1.p3 TRINITY_DN115209_c0_g1~~TRINITY_DN115209_c0_g1_i1.p3  ORF type:complete len:103 (-),score=19.50 TRINITY_DN115209_c0_g1_i1:108-416(-)
MEPENNTTHDKEIPTKKKKQKTKPTPVPLYVIHEHSQYTSAVDKYWYFVTRKLADKFWKEMVCNWRDTFDPDEEKSLSEWYDETYIELEDDDFISWEEATAE